MGSLVVMSHVFEPYASWMKPDSPQLVPQMLRTFHEIDQSLVFVGPSLRAISIFVGPSLSARPFRHTDDEIRTFGSSFSRLVRDAGAAVEGMVCSRRGSLAHSRSRSVGLSVSIDRSFGNFGVLSAQAQPVPLRTS